MFIVLEGEGTYRFGTTPIRSRPATCSARRRADRDGASDHQYRDETLRYYGIRPCATDVCEYPTRQVRVFSRTTGNRLRQADRPALTAPAAGLDYWDGELGEDTMTTPMLEIRNLHARIEDREILKGVNLTVPAGEVHAIMGRNGSGKSTLSYVLAGKEDYEVTEGEVLLDGENILEMDPAERAAAGLFLAFQYPIEIPGVATMTFLKAAMNAQRKARGEARAVDARLHARGEGSRRDAQYRQRHAEARRSMSASPAARRSAPRSCRWRCSSPRCASSTRPIPASTSMRCRSSPRASTRCAAPTARCW